MLSSPQIATMVLRHVIFHDVPNQRGSGGASVVLATIPTQIDAERRTLLKEKLTKTLDSRYAYGITFEANTTSPVPAIVQDLTATGFEQQRFVNFSQELARHLYQVQTGAVSAGLLCVIDVTVSNQHGLVLMKLEREAGAELRMTQTRNGTRFDMSVLDSLVLTGNTRLYKTAAFLRVENRDGEFEMVACDNQHNPTDTKEMARFWRKYLGCELEEAARVTTSKFFNATMDFINVHVSDPEAKTVLYESLHVAMRSAAPTFTPRSFITEHVPEEIRPSFREYLSEKSVSMSSFQKDTQDIRNAIRKLTYVSEAGVRIVAPEGRDELVDVQTEQIVVKDRLSRLGGN